MKQAASWVPTWARRLLFGRRRYDWQRVAEAPDKPEDGMVYLVGEPEPAWSAVLRCPCGCEATIALSLLRDDSPRWSARVSKQGALTLHPSVWRVRDCRSHFNLIEGRVLWARSASRTQFQR